MPADLILSNDGIQFANGSVQGRAVFPVPVRQTVLSGPVDTNGFSAFGGSTGSTTVTATGTLRATAANGFDATGQLDYEGNITNPSWTSLSTNGTMYLYLDIALNGTCTTGSTTLAPTYRWGGADVTTNNQFTFNIQEMVGKVGNGSVATQTYRVFVGEVTVAGGVTTAITWYALMGRYVSALYGLALSTAYNLNHNIGVTPMFNRTVMVCQTAEGGYLVGDEIDNNGINTSNNSSNGYSPAMRRNSILVNVGVTNISAINSTFFVIYLTTANWKLKTYSQRGW
jgi:hypothetical protein